MLFRSVPFPGVEQMLDSFRSRGVGLALATNKRQKPTAGILKALGWQDHFRHVETVDSRSPLNRSKAEMLRDILALDDRPPSSAAYLGDTAADVVAAREAGLPCIFATWGYGKVQSEKTEICVARPEHVEPAFVTVLNLPMNPAVGD